MKRKLLTMGIALVVLFSLVVLTGCNDTRAETDFRESLIIVLQLYAYGIGDSNFSDENWQRIEGYIEVGKTNINESEFEFVAYFALTKAMRQISVVPKLEFDDCENTLATPKNFRVGEHNLFYWDDDDRTNDYILYVRSSQCTSFRELWRGNDHHYLIHGQHGTHLRTFAQIAGIVSGVVIFRIQAFSRPWINDSPEYYPSRFGYVAIYIGSNEMGIYPPQDPNVN